jgi:hypothetical protein
MSAYVFVVSLEMIRLKRVVLMENSPNWWDVEELVKVLRD